MALIDNCDIYYKLDGNSNDAVGSNNGTDTNITYSTGNGKINQGAGFNGTSSKIAGSTVNGTTNMSISCWVKTTATPTANTPLFGFFKSGGYTAFMFFISVYTGPTLGGFYTQDSDNTTGPINVGTINDGNWHFLVMTKTGNVIQPYIDGSPAGSPVTNAFTGNFDGMGLLYGYVSDFGAHYFNGSVDECGYWSRALSSTEITELYNGGAGFSYPFSTTAIKSWNGLAIASVKKINGLAIASVKKINGLA